MNGFDDETGTIRINVSVADEHWSAIDVPFVQNVVAAVLEQEGPFDDAEITVRITGDDEIHDLNRTFRDVDSPTDVLSFGVDPEEDGPGVVLPGDMHDQLGDVVVSYPAAKRQAAEYGHSVKRELGWLVTHGVLQLLGYTHYTPHDEKLMRLREEMVLHRLGLDREDKGRTAT